MPRIALIVDFRMPPEQRAACRSILAEHATKTLAEEPGCTQFDLLDPQVTEGEPDPGRIMLYEVYVDAAALAAHRAGPRMPGVGAAITPLIDSQTITTCLLD